MKHARPKIDQRDANANAGTLIAIAIAIYAACFLVTIVAGMSPYIALVAGAVIILVARPYVIKRVIDRNDRQTVRRPGRF